MRTDWVTEEKIDTTASTLFGAVAGGAVTGLIRNIACGRSLTLGAGNHYGGAATAGALGRVRAATAYNVKKDERYEGENLISWSPSAMEGFVVETVALFSRCNFSRGRVGNGNKADLCLLEVLVEKIGRKRNFRFQRLPQKSKRSILDQRKAEFEGF